MKRRTDFWADWAGKQRERGERTGEHKLRKTMEKGTDDWGDSNGKGRRPEGMDKWLGERKHTSEMQLNLWWRPTWKHVDTMEWKWKGGKNIWWVAGAPDSQPPEILMNVHTERAPGIHKNVSVTSWTCYPVQQVSTDREHSRADTHCFILQHH